MLLCVITIVLSFSYVQPAPGDIMFKTCPEDLQVFQGMSAQFECEAMVAGNNMIDIDWFKVADNDAQIQIDVSDTRVAIVSSASQNSQQIFSTFTLSDVSVLDAATYLCVADTGFTSESKSATLAVVMSTTQYTLTTSKTESMYSVTALHSQSWSMTISPTSTVASYPSTFSQSNSQARIPSSITQVIYTHSIQTSPAMMSIIPFTATPFYSTLTTTAVQSSASTPIINFTINPTILSITPFIVPTQSFAVSHSLVVKTNEVYTVFNSESRSVSSPTLILSQSASQPTITTELQPNSVSYISPSFALPSLTYYSTSQSVVNTNYIMTTRPTSSKISSLSHQFDLITSLQPTYSISLIPSSFICTMSSVPATTRSTVHTLSVSTPSIGGTLAADKNFITSTLQSKVSTFSMELNTHLFTTFPIATPITGQTEGHCPPGDDGVWGIYWPKTEGNMSYITNCSEVPAGTNSTTGQAKRYCSSSGEWEIPDVSSCQNAEYAIILSQVSAISNFTEADLVGEITRMMSKLAALSVINNNSLLPSSLDAANQILVTALDALERVQSISVEIIEFFVDVLNNLLDLKNSGGWIALQSDMENTGRLTALLLSTTERVGELLARAQGNSESKEPIKIVRPNIAMSAKEYRDIADIDSTDLSFPKQLPPTPYIMSAQIQLPQSLVKEKLNQQKIGAVPVVFMLIQNIASFLPSTLSGQERVQGASAVLTAQVGPRNNSKLSQALQATPVLLKFNVDENVENISRHHCVFWNFSNPVGNGSWSTDGLNTKHVMSEESPTTVQCTSTHLTSFAVLVSIGGVRQNSALQVVSYIGCCISILCLLLTIIFFLSQWKDLLFHKVHYFVHLNLALSLFLAYIVFVVGIETARGNQAGCAFVAALLHYLFLAAFCWMLCEGVMIYLLLVLVFSQLKNKWWFFLILGYLPPLLIVVISVAARWDDYGVKDDNGNIQFCWLSTNNGTIAAFIAPMLIILLINVVFMFLALRVIWKNKTGLLRKVSSSKKEEKKSFKSFELVKSLLTATIVLLPILGLTWIFGVLAVNENSEFFAWIFTILNSLQGVFIFIFHVVKTEKVLKKIKAFFYIKKASGSVTYGPRGTQHISSDSGTLKSTLSYNGTIQRNQDFDMSNRDYGFEEKSLDSTDLST